MTVKPLTASVTARRKLYVNFVLNAPKAPLLFEHFSCCRRARRAPSWSWVTSAASIERNKLMVQTQNENFQINFAMGGITGSSAKPITASDERIKLMMQTQDTAQDLRGEIPRYTGIAYFVRCAS